MNLIETDFWVVTKATSLSTLDDILFKTTWQGLQRQFAGGLILNQIAGIFMYQIEARELANDELEQARQSVEF